MSEYDFNNEVDRKRFYRSRAWRQIREQVLERDHHECVWCAKEGKVTTKDRLTLEVDHIEELQDNPERALDIENLRALCRQVRP